MKKVLTLGEIMLRLSPPDNQRLAQANSFNLVFGGSEANVAAGLANFGIAVTHVTAFPDHDLGKAAVSHLRKNGIDTSFVKFLPGRLGVYFLEQGSGLRGSKIVYDRSASSFSNYDGSDQNWEEILQGFDWVHWSGITPALSQASADLTWRILQAARNHQISVSGDLNYRSNLWNYGKRPDEIMPRLIELTTHIIGGKRDFNQCLNQNYQSFEEAGKSAFEQFENLEMIIKTNRIVHSASHNTLSAESFTKNSSYSTKKIEIQSIIDRVGTGDAFASGLIFGLINEKSIQDSLEFGLGSAVLKHSIPGDVLMGSEEEIKEILEGKSGAIKR
jgi:2-dehydro-3-deoxygluconokinase